MALKWLSVAEAASILEVSERTVRRRVQRGMLHGQPGSAGRLEVQVPVAGASPAGDPVEDEASAEQPRPATAGVAGKGPNQGMAETRENPAGAYSPLPSGTREDAGPRTLRPRRGQASFAPGELMQEGTDEDELTRYQRLAGASVLLAQRQADEANEKVVLARARMRRLRKLNIIGWSAVAGLAIAVLMVVGLLGSSAAGAHAELAAQRRQTLAARSETRQAYHQIVRLQHRLGEQTADTRARSPWRTAAAE